MLGDKFSSLTGQMLERHPTIQCYNVKFAQVRPLKNQRLIVRFVGLDYMLSVMGY